MASKMGVSGLKFLLIFSLSFIELVESNKYSAAMNQKSFEKDYKNLEKPFRMQKVNLLWEKAQKRLAPEKLKNLYLDLKLQDKDEIALKRLKGEGGDKEGWKETELRRRFKSIMDKYDLGKHLEHVEEILNKQPKIFNEATEEEIAKKLFKDKKLNKLWAKIEKSAFTEEELLTLKQEFGHHQEKLEEYSELMNEVGQKAGGNDMDNTIAQFHVLDGSEKKKRRSFEEASQALKEKHKEVKGGYEKLEKIVASKGSSDFDEVRVEELWKLAKKADFTPEELESLKEELHHYEHRIRKLKHFETQLDFNGINGDPFLNKQTPEERDHIKKKVKEYGHKVSKIHNDLQTRIMERHIEL